jgi:mono/diheme cytochrome c family protein
MKRPLVVVSGLAALVWIVCGVAPVAAAPGVGAAVDVPQQVTFHEHVEPLLQRSCQGCHRPEGAAYGGMRAPMSLVTYADARPWAKSIARQVEAKKMPPWFASEHTAGQFENERTLTDDEIATLVRWANTGARQGDPTNAPEPIEWESWEGWIIGEPDLVISLKEPFWVSDDVVDLNIRLEGQEIRSEMLPEPRYIRAVEFRPGSEVVHHVIGTTLAAEAEVPGATGMIGGIAPGSEPFVLPDGVARPLVAGTKIYFSMHYNKEPGEGTGVWDNSQIGFKFHPEGARIDKIAKWTAIGNRDFEIPPDTREWKVGAAMTFPHETTIFGYLPHMHLRGRAATYTAVYPDGRRELLLHVPWYDWNWQTNYSYREPKVIAAGTRVEVEMLFDNTEERDSLTFLEIDPHRAVRFGGPTTDEMMLGWIDYAENIPVEEQEFDAFGRPSGAPSTGDGE